MKVFSVNQVKSIINAFEEKGLECIDNLGSKSGVYLDGAIKYAAYDSNIKLFSVDHHNDMEKTICFVLEDCVLDYSDVKNTFGPLRSSYSFTDNYSQFDIDLPSNKVVSEIYFVKRNGYKYIGDNKFIKLDSMGKETEVSKLVFDRFYLKITL